MTRPTVHIAGGTSPTAQLRDKLAAQMPHVDPFAADPARAAEQAAAVDRDAAALLADAIATADQLNAAMFEDRADAQALDNLVVDPHRDDLGRYATRMRPNPAQGSSGQPAIPTPQSPLDRIRSNAQRHTGYTPPAA